MYCLYNYLSNILYHYELIYYIYWLFKYFSNILYYVQQKLIAGMGRYEQVTSYI